MTSMSLPRSMWFHSASFALSRECHGFKLFQCTLFSPHVTHSVPLRLCILFSMYIVIHVESKADTMFGWFESIVYGETSSAWHCGVIVLQERIMSACSAWHCGVVASETRTPLSSEKCSMFWTSLRLTLWSAWVRVNISMGIQSMAQTPLMVRCLFNACVHCKDKPFVVRDSIVLMSSTPNCRSGQSEVAAVMSWCLFGNADTAATDRHQEHVLLWLQCWPPPCSPPCSCHAAEDELFWRSLCPNRLWFNVHFRCPLYSACSIFHSIAVWWSSECVLSHI